MIKKLVMKQREVVEVTNGEHCAISFFKMYLAAEGYCWIAKDRIEHSEMSTLLAPYLENEALIKRIKHNTLL
jgi:hypothetical protein